MNNKNSFEGDSGDDSEIIESSGTKYDVVYVEVDEDELDCDIVEGQIVEIQEEYDVEVLEVDSELDVDIVDVDLSGLSLLDAQKRVIEGDDSGENSVLKVHDVPHEPELLAHDDEDTEIDENIESSLLSSTLLNKIKYNSDSAVMKNNSKPFSKPWPDDLLSKAVLLLFIIFAVLFIFYVFELLF